MSWAFAVLLLEHSESACIEGVLCYAVALAFQAQMVEEVPMAENDRGVDIIITADGAIAASAAGTATLSS